MSWGKVCKKFWKSNLEFQQRVAEKKQKLRSELDEESKCIQHTTVDPNTGNVTIIKEKRKEKLTPEEELEFFDRIDAMLRRREEKLKSLDSHIYKEKYPFKPNISSLASLRGDNKDDGDDDDEMNAREQFLKRYKEDLDYRREKYPKKYLANTRKSKEEEEFPPFRVSKSLDQGKIAYMSYES